ncbi:MAG TPA: hypothetical protein VF530_04195 [Planctomycetota bacterium]
MTHLDEIAAGLERCYARIEADPALRAEFAGSRGDFFARPEAAALPGAELRLLEWFLLERPSATLGAVPLVAFATPGTEPELSAELRAALLGSLPGAFEVTSAGEADGSWVRDLFTQGELPLVAAEGAAPLAAGDVLVGRLFPVGDGTFVPSSAASVYRSPELLRAVRADLAAMRRARRGVLRIQQLELEHLFHGLAPALAANPSASVERVDPGPALRALGLEEHTVTSILANLRAGAGGQDAVTEILNQLAFETPVDLRKAREILLDAWLAERPAAAPPELRADARAALAAFDRGRAEGKDLELLFRELERDLGLEDEPEEEDEAGVPDFPGVVGAMVEEFLWDVEREQGGARARGLAPLRKLGEYAQDIGVFEDLGRLRLLDFSARWLLDETGLAGPELGAVLDALAEFCAWAEERHELPLAREFGTPLAALRQSVPRLAAARAGLSRAAGGELFAVVALRGERVELRSLEGAPLALPVPAELRAHLRVGDWLRLAGEGRGIAAVYPAEIREALGA